jgi:recombination protein RecA
MKLFASATARMEICAYIDATGTFDPFSAVATGVLLSQLVWVRCEGNVDAALRSADHLLQAGGFGVVALDLGGISIRILRRIPSSFWYRYRRVIEHTPTILVILGREIVTRSCASLQLKLRPEKTLWVARGGGSGLFRGLSFELLRVKPMRQGTVSLIASPRLS